MRNNIHQVLAIPLPPQQSLHSGGGTHRIAPQRIVPDCGSTLRPVRLELADEQAKFPRVLYDRTAATRAVFKAPHLLPLFDRIADKILGSPNFLANLAITETAVVQRYHFCAIHQCFGGHLFENRRKTCDKCKQDKHKNYPS